MSNLSNSSFIKINNSTNSNSKIHFESENLISYSSIKFTIWIYLSLVLFEGALRKWILPQLSSPLLIIRDPIAIIILYQAFKKNLIENNFILFIFISISILSIPIAVVYGHGNLIVALFGARIFFLHMPLIFIIGKVFTISDVIKYGKYLIILSIPTTILLSIQFYSPQSSFVNIGVAGDTNGSGFGAVGDYFRPAGLFSFTSGNVCFYCLSLCYILSFWISKEIYVNQLVLIISTLFFVVAVPICVSRTLLFQIVISFIFVLLAVAGNKRLLFKILLFIIFLALFYPIINGLSSFQESSDVLTERFTSANESEGGLHGVLIDRFLGGLWGAIFSDNAYKLPYWGLGIGMGTNVGAQLLAGKTIFLISEGEWGRLVGELGLLFGISLILARCYLGIELLIKSYKKIKNNNIFPWMLMSYGFLLILQNQLGSPNSLGFTVTLGGLALASLNHNYT